MSTYSQVEIINNALILLSAEQILSIDTNTPSAKKAKVIYPVARDSLLEAHPWNFATKRVTLASLTDTPAFEYSNIFEVPTDWIKTLDLYPPEIEYKMEGNRIYCNEPSLALKYTARIEDTTKYSAMFVDTLAACLAWKLAYPITQSSSMVSNMYDLYSQTLKMARTSDAQNDTPDDGFKYGNTWLDARL